MGGSRLSGELWLGQSRGSDRSAGASVAPLFNRIKDPLFNNLPQVLYVSQLECERRIIRLRLRIGASVAASRGWVNGQWADGHRPGVPSAVPWLC